ncbi:Phospholipid hydroperoxide glutathione, partial [Globisporangium polare]
MQAHQQQQQPPKPTLEGHVFARQELFVALPKDLQEDTKHFRNYVEQDKRRLFQVHSHALVKSVYSVTGKELVDAIIQWLHAHSGPEQNAPIQHSGADVSFAGRNVGQTHGVLKGATATGPAPTKGAAGSAATAPTSSKARNVTERLECAKQIAEALVLIGFITPYTDNATHLNYIAPEHYVHDSELLIPIAPSVTDLDATSVWSVADGAAYARNLKRKAGMLAPFTDGQHVYVVFNDKTKKAYLFESDLAREPISELSGPTLNVEFDNSHFEFGVRVSLRSGVETNTPETFNAETQERQQELMKAWLSLGATYK